MDGEELEGPGWDEAAIAATAAAEVAAAAEVEATAAAEVATAVVAALAEAAAATLRRPDFASGRDRPLFFIGLKEVKHSCQLMKWERKNK